MSSKEENTRGIDLPNKKSPLRLFLLLASATILPEKLSSRPLSHLTGVDRDLSSEEEADHIQEISHNNEGLEDKPPTPIEVGASVV